MTSRNTLLALSLASSFSLFAFALPSHAQGNFQVGPKTAPTTAPKTVITKTNEDGSKPDESTESNNTSFKDLMRKPAPNLPGSAKDFREIAKDQAAERARRGFVSAEGVTPGTGDRWTVSLVPVSNTFEQGVRKTVQPASRPSDQCHTEQIQIAAGAEELGDFNPNPPGWLKPGIVMTAQGFAEGKYTVPSGERKPITLSTTARGGQSVVTVNNPKISQINAGLHTLLSGDMEEVPASFIHDYREIHSLEEFGFYLNGAYSNPFAKGALALSHAESSEKRKYIIEFEQPMYSVEVDDLHQDDVFRIPAENTDGLVYISRVTYGRRGVALVTSRHDISKTSGGVEAALNLVLHQGYVKSGFDTFSQGEDFQIQAVLYGGDSEAAIRALMNSIESRSLDLGEYLETAAGNPKLAKPISYELRNLHGERVGVRSSFDTNVTTCVPSLADKMRLRISLTDLVNIQSRDSDKRDDYGLNQHVELRALGKSKRAVSNDIRKFRDQHDEPFYMDGVVMLAENRIINGNKARQIRVREDSHRSGNINNSLVFEITREEFEDPDARLSIYTWLKEYSAGEDLVLENFERIDIPLREVITYVRAPGRTGLAFNSELFQTGIERENVFWASGPNTQKLWLSEGPNGSIEGPIVLGRSGAMAATWINFSEAPQ